MTPRMEPQHRGRSGTSSSTYRPLASPLQAAALGGILFAVLIGALPASLGSSLATALTMGLVGGLLSFGVLASFGPKLSVQAPARKPSRFCPPWFCTPWFTRWWSVFLIILITVQYLVVVYDSPGERLKTALLVVYAFFEGWRLRGRGAKGVERRITQGS